MDINIPSAESHKKQVPILGAVRIVEPEPDGVTELIHWTAAEIRELERLERALIRVRKREMNRDITWRVAAMLRGLHIECRTTVHQAFPCATCARPIAQLKPLYGKRLLLVDAELTPIPGICEADLLKPHVCEVRP